MHSYLGKGEKKVLFCEPAVHLGGGGGLTKGPSGYFFCFFVVAKIQFFFKISLPFAARDQIMPIVIYK